MTEIGAFEANTQFLWLVARARGGEIITITDGGVAVARLVPARSPDEASARRAFSRLRRRAAERHGGSVDSSEILAWRDEGRLR